MQTSPFNSPIRCATPKGRFSKKYFLDHVRDSCRQLTATAVGAVKGDLALVAALSHATQTSCRLPPVTRTKANVPPRNKPIRCATPRGRFSKNNSLDIVRDSCRQLTATRVDTFNKIFFPLRTWALVCKHHRSARQFAAQLQREDFQKNISLTTSVTVAINSRQLPSALSRGT